MNLSTVYFLLALSISAFSMTAALACQVGQVKTVDTAGRCCWPGQVWAPKKGCVGQISACISGMSKSEDGQRCVLEACEPEQVRQADRVHCCWPGQGWSSAEAACVGAPECPALYLAQEGGCSPGPELTDLDGDGRVDARDQCVERAEDLDGFEDEDGCPDDDNDQDHIKDAADACPNAPEDVDGHLDIDGCPDPDNDADGYLDSEDACPDDAEDLDGFEDEDGCPDDNDGDGVDDQRDQCPSALEDRDGHQDGDGCPDPDNDGDGILDAADRCVDLPEDYDLYKDSDGCPDEDNDQDGVLDRDDLCPHEREDRQGVAQGDGCEIPLAEVWSFVENEELDAGATLAYSQTSLAGDEMIGGAALFRFDEVTFGVTMMKGAELFLVGASLDLELGHLPQHQHTALTLFSPAIGVQTGPLVSSQETEEEAPREIETSASSESLYWLIRPNVSNTFRLGFLSMQLIGGYTTSFTLIDEPSVAPLSEGIFFEWRAGVYF